MPNCSECNAADGGFTCPDCGEKLCRDCMASHVCADADPQHWRKP